jgi:serine/threonine protein kinase HipA of HipAB toxin-antitoxin module
MNSPCSNSRAARVSQCRTTVSSKSWRSRASPRRRARRDARLSPCSASTAAGGAPVHTEDFAQLFGQYPNDKYHFRSYAHIASVLWAEAGENAVAEFVRRLVFSVVIVTPIHLKNWSLRYPDRRKPVLSPGYDLGATLPLYFPTTRSPSVSAAAAACRKSRPAGCGALADTARIPASALWKIAVETAERAAAAWNGLEQADLLPEDQRASIGNQIFRVAATVK